MYPRAVDENGGSYTVTGETISTSPPYIPASYQLPTVGNAPVVSERIITETTSAVPPGFSIASVAAFSAGGGGGSVGDYEPQRKSTDVHWLAVFSGFGVFCLFFLLLAFSEGSPARLTRGINYQGKNCGVDASVRHLPYLYVPLDPRESYATLMLDDARCVESCPTEEDVEAGKTIPVPVRETEVDSGGRNSALTVQYMLQSPAYAAAVMAGAYCVPLDTSLRGQMAPILNGSFRQAQIALGSFRASWWCVVGYTLLAGVFAAGFALLLRLSPGVVLGIGAIWTICLAIVAGAQLVKTGLGGVLDPDKGSFYSLDYSWALFVGIVLIALGGLMALLLFAARRAIGNAVRLLECAGEAVSDMIQLFLAPIIFGTISSLWLWFWIEAYMYIVSAGTVDTTEISLGLDPNGDVDFLPLHRRVVWDARFILFGLLWWGALFWVLEALLAFCNFVIAYAGTVWYFSPPEGSEERDVGWYPPLVAVGLGATHHIGSFAVGGLVMGFTRPIRILCAWASTKNLTLYQYSPIVRNLIDCFRSVMQPTTFIVDRFTSSGFIEMSISSKPFFPAMDKSCSRILNSRSPASYLHGAANLCSVIGTSAVSLTTTFMCYQTLTGTEKYSSLTSPTFVAAPLCVSLFVGLIAAVIASQFMAVWDVVADTFMYCFLVEAIQPPVVDENPMTKVHAPACLRELLLDAQQEFM